MVTSALLLHSRAHLVMMETRDKTGRGQPLQKNRRMPQWIFTPAPPQNLRDHARILNARNAATACSMPEWSELVDDLRVRHLWECDACGYAFETTVRFAEAA